ncbi:hypothetical protein [uncultured Haliea sp.]|uniref:hypothetical protein n=1 Tax=uncultured Haliea sp. TaxID=622616 RepID=UPI002684988A
MMHTTPSQIYRAERIPGHRYQCLAALKVMLWLHANHSGAVWIRHREAVLRALANMEHTLT